jgi:ligand-binding sensor domain-containing protein
VLRLKSGLLSLLLLAPAVSATALDPAKAVTQYVLDAWDTRSGLPNDSVSALAQTRDGYLWVGTVEGLGRFDGQGFTRFDSSIPGTLRASYVRALLVDREGALWIGTHGGGVTRLRNGQFRTWTSAEGLSHDVVRVLLEDRDGGVWVGTGSGVTLVRDAAVRKLGRAQGLSGDVVLSLAQQKDGTLWVGHRNGLDRVAPQGRVTAFGARQGLPPGGISALKVDASGTLWAGSSRGSLARLAGGRFVPAAGWRDPKRATVYAIAEDRHGSLWVGTFGGGLGRLSRGGVEVLGAGDGLGSDAVLSVFEDREGSLWVGTGTGLRRLRSGRVTTYSAREGLVPDYIWGIFEDGRGQIHFGTTGGLRTRRGERFFSPIARDELASAWVYSIAETRDGSLWIGTLNGLSRLRGERLTSFARPQGLRSEEIRALLAASDGGLWIGTYGGGLHHFDGSRVVPVTGSPQLESGLVVCLYEDPSGALWIGTDGDGLVRLDRDGTIVRQTVSDGLGSDRIRALHRDAQGRLWVATSGGGLSRLEATAAAGGGARRRWSTWSTAQGLPATTFHAILQDDSGHLWLSSNRGIVRVAIDELDAVARGQRPRVEALLLGISDGMLSAECNGNFQPAALRASDGTLWFPTSKGAVRVDPATLVVDTAPPPVVIDSVLADREALPVQERVRVPPGTAHLEIGYAGLRLASTSPPRFRYRLIGYDEDWVEAGPHRTAYYGRLRPGSYSFRVVAASEDGSWRGSGASLSLTVAPRFHETLWFRGLVALLLVAGLWAAYRLRVASLRGREAELKRRVDEATAHLKILRGLLPVCAWCRKVRDDDGYWQQLEDYLQDHSNAEFSHGICPECLDAHFANGTDRSQS